MDICVISLTNRFVNILYKSDGVKKYISKLHEKTRIIFY